MFKPTWPNWRAVIVTPQRVSRLYPVFSLVLAITSSSLVYAWKETEIRTDSTFIAQSRTIAALEEQVTALTAQQKTDQTTLEAQRQQVAAAQSTLESVQKQLDAKASELASREAQLAAAQAQLKNQQSQLSTTSSELDELRNRPPLFSFKNESTLSDIDAKKEAVKQLITDAYPYATQLYGKAYLLKQVTITFVNALGISGAAAETVISNGPDGMTVDIHLRDFESDDFDDVNSVLHEVFGHSWHGIAVLDPSAFEEGYAVAGTDALMAMLEADKKIPDFGSSYITITDSQYQSYNQTLKVVADADSFYSDPKISKVYQMLGKAWYRLYEAKPTFFSEFNAAYYAKFQKGQTVDVAAFKDIIKGIVPSVKGQGIDQYLSANRAFNPS